MPELAACYFCGAALDESLSTVRLGDAPDATTLTLCEGCKEKLQTVLEAVDTGTASVPRDAPATGTQSADTPRETPAAGDAEASSADTDDERTNAPPGPEEEAETAEPAADTADAAAGNPTESAGDDSGERSIVEGDQEISALEYNKVMRLLQNREFPVDREEIVTVAANAYQVSRADCDRVIEVAIDRGLFDERDGQLVRTD